MVRFDLSDFFSVHRLLYWRNLLWRSQYYSIKQQKMLQWKLLSRLLDHCFMNVPYYKEQLTSLGLSRCDFNSLDDLSGLPVIGKSDVFDHFETFKSNRFERYRPKLMQTAGTTGSPMKVYWDINSNVLELTCQWRHLSWFKYRLGEPFLDVRNFRLHLTDKWAWNWKCRGLETSISFWNESNIDEFFEMLKKYNIRHWRGHPEAIFQLCLYFKQAGIHEAKPKSIITTANSLLTHQRTFIEDWTGCTIGDSYGLTEHTALICRCPRGSYHIASEYGIVEILRDDGTPVRPGEKGRIVSTGLHNMAFPLLRYDTGDYAISSDGGCSCGRTLPVVQEITGRIDDYVFDVKGRRVSSLVRIFKYTHGIRYSQVVQYAMGSLDIYIVPTEDYDRAVQEKIVADLHLELGINMKIRVHLVDALPVRSSKKFKFVVNKVRDPKCP